MRPYPLMVDVVAQKFNVFINNGDTIYETSSTGSPATPATKDAETGVVSQKALLDAYHTKYLENLLPAPGGTYSGLKDFFGAQANFTSYDNHELGNRAFINGGAPYSLRTSTANGSANPADDVNKTGLFINDAVTFDTLQQAFLDYQPIRTPELIVAPTDPRSDGELKLYATQQWGQNAQIFNLDTRTFRDVRLNKATGGDDTGARADNPERTLLGATQKAWFKQSLLDAQAAGVTWKFVNITDPIDMIGAYGTGEDGGKSWWGGYRAERNELLKFIDDNNIRNVVFLASDDHQGRINELTYLPDASLDPTNPANYKVLKSAFSIVDGPLGATGPNLVTDHSYTNVKAIADTLAANQVAAGLNPIGLDKNFPGLFNVYREGDATAASSPKPVDFYSPDTYNYISLDVTVEGVLTVTMRGVNSYASNTFPEPSAANAARTILSFSVDGNPVIAGSAGDDTNEPGFSTLPAFTGEAQILHTGAGKDQLDIALVAGSQNVVFTGADADTAYANDRDVITGGTGGDTFWAIDGDGNRLDGGKDNDTFYLASKRNRALGGEGDDRFYVLDGAGTNYLNGGSGRDQFWLITAAGDRPASRQQIMDFKVGEDLIGLKGVSFASLAFSQQGRDTLLSLDGKEIGLFSSITASTLANPNIFLGLV
jgi:Ca2+-binding RTX toxin-like protein